MRTIITSLMTVALAACSQTTDPVATAQTPASRTKPTAQAAAPADKCDTAIRNQANAAMVGSALGMVGGFGGFAGRGGAVASHVASTAGGAIAQAQASQARANVHRDCLGSANS